MVAHELIGDERSFMPKEIVRESMIKRPKRERLLINSLEKKEA